MSPNDNIARSKPRNKDVKFYSIITMFIRINLYYREQVYCLVCPPFKEVRPGM